MSKLKAPITYFGGKGTMANTILNFFPLRYTHYIEPFGGAFNMGLSQERPNVAEVYNDLEQNVYSLYKVIADKELFEQLHQKLELAIYSEQFRLESLEALKTELSLVDRAYHFFYVCRTSRNGIAKFGFSNSNLIRRGISHSVNSFLSAIERLPELHQRLSTVTILNTDGIELLKRYNFPEAFCYCDPPYEQSTRSEARYKLDMNRDTQIRFLETIKDSKAQCMISGYNNDLYNEILGEKWHRIDFTVNSPNAINVGPKTKIESLWRNYGNFEVEMC